MSPATHIYHAGASLSPTKLVSPDAVARLVGANPAKSSSPHSKGLGFNPQQDLERQKEMIERAELERNENQKKKKESKKAEKPSLKQDRKITKANYKVSSADHGVSFAS